MLKLVLASSLALVSSASFAHVKVSQGPLNIDQNSVRFVGACSDGDSLADFNADGSFDLIFNNLDARAERRGEHESKTCMVKFNAKLPKGWTIAVSKVSVAGLSTITAPRGETRATLRHTLGGSVGPAAIASYSYDPHRPDQDVILEQPFAIATSDYLPCGGDVTFKSTIFIEANRKGAAIRINEGAQRSKQYNVRYYWSWKKC